MTLDELKNLIETHGHDGTTSKYFPILKTVSIVPTYNPRSFLDQFVLYKNGATIRVYIYINNSWHYANLT